MTCIATLHGMFFDSKTVINCTTLWPLYGNVQDFCGKMITYSDKQKLDLTYLWQKLRRSVKFKHSGKIMIKEWNKYERISL